MLSWTSYFIDKPYYFILIVLLITSTISFIIFKVLDIREEKYRELLLKSGIYDIDKMTGIEFEEYLKALYIEDGYQVTSTPQSGDFGSDLIIEDGNIQIAVQVKRYKKNVGLKAVQEVVSAKSYYRTDTAWVVTNSYFTKPAEKLAAITNVHLFNRDDLIRYSTEIKQLREYTSRIERNKIKKTLF